MSLLFINARILPTAADLVRGLSELSHTLNIGKETTLPDNFLGLIYCSCYFLSTTVMLWVFYLLEVVFKWKESPDIWIGLRAFPSNSHLCEKALLLWNWVVNGLSYSSLFLTLKLNDFVCLCRVNFWLTLFLFNWQVFSLSTLDLKGTKAEFSTYIFWGRIHPDMKEDWCALVSLIL